MNHRHSFLKEMRSILFRIFSAYLLIVSLCQPTATADNVFMSGATIRINPGTFVTTFQDVLVENGGMLTIDGSLILKYNFTNQNPVADLGKGTIVFSGTSPQSIVGQNILGKLVVNNPAGLDLLGNTVLYNELGLLNGTIRLGANNLTLGNQSTISGNPSASAMVVATGSGELRKSFSGTGSFTFPVGDESGKAEFTPVTVSFTTGNFATENYAGVTLKPTGYPGYSGNSLNRTWSLTQSGISGFKVDALFQYAAGDNTGNENELYCTQVEPDQLVSYNPSNVGLHQLSASGLGSFGTFTGITRIKTDITLEAGWNLFSSYVTPVDQDLKDDFQSVINKGTLKKVMDENSKTIENAGTFGGWKNNIGKLTSYEGYKVNVTAASTLSLEGLPVRLPIGIILNKGWNIISYPTASAQDAKVLLQTCIDEGRLNKVMDESGKTLENFGAFGGWKNSIGNFTPSHGYKVNVTENCVLTIPEKGTYSAVVVPEVLPGTYFKPIFVGNGTDHMNIHLVNLQSSGLRPGDEIGVFDGEYCVGSVTVGSEQITGGWVSIAASSNDELNEIPDGFTTGHPVSLQLVREGQTFLVNAAIVSGSETFEKNGSMFAQVNSLVLTDIQSNEEMAQFKCFPNPFTQEMTIEVQNPEKAEITEEICNLSGQHIKSLFKGINNGSLVLKWNGQNESGQPVAPGVYLCKVNGQTKQVIYQGNKGEH
ncbi:MAG TPA: hypothetical protein DCL77_16700 [Prolixibacteraceae bacterium]|nr:hypothetical protein [Prolixibacteraceae bacterium]